MTTAVPIARIPLLAPLPTPARSRALTAYSLRKLVYTLKTFLSLELCRELPRISMLSLPFFALEFKTLKKDVLSGIDHALTFSALLRRKVIGI